jgi:predicted secreted protein
MIHFTASEANVPAAIPRGEAFEISLPENQSTGFRWKVTAAGEPVARITDDTFQPARAVGGAGTHHWRFQTTRTGEAEIRMILQRSWEASGHAAQSFTLPITVTS